MSNKLKIILGSGLLIAVAMAAASVGGNPTVLAIITITLIAALIAELGR